MGALWHKLVVNWATTIPAVLIAICTTTALAEVVPSEYYKYLMAVCGFLTAIGFFAAKAQGVSNSPDPRAAAPVSETNLSKPNPAAVVIDR